MDSNISPWREGAGYIAEGELRGDRQGSQKFGGVPKVRIHLPPAESRCKPGFLSVLGRKPAAQPDIDLKKQMRNAFPGAPKTEVGEVIVRATFIGGDLSVEPNSETRIGVDEGVHLTRTMLTSMSLVHAFANR
jgi:hypothetical protein